MVFLKGDLIALVFKAVLEVFQPRKRLEVIVGQRRFARLGHRQIDRVLKAMRYLHPEDCALIGMRDVEGLTVSELKQVTGLAEGTIKSRLHRARKKLGRLLHNTTTEKPKLRVVGGMA